MREDVRTAAKREQTKRALVEARHPRRVTTEKRKADRMLSTEEERTLKRRHDVECICVFNINQ